MLGLFPNGFHDPCAGLGTIIDVGLRLGCSATGADIRNRADGRFPTRDFFKDRRRYQNIICNPPFAAAAAIVEHALDFVTEGGRVAILAPLNFACSQGRYRLFSRPEMDAVIFLSRRPSVPPGAVLQTHGETIRHSGSIDFAWYVWQQGRGRWPAKALWAAP